MVLPLKGVTVDDVKQERISREGHKTRALFVERLEMPDWEIIEQIKAQNGIGSVAAAVRWALRKAAGRI